jgi:hypothetical protein
MECDQTHHQTEQLKLSNIWDVRGINILSDNFSSVIGKNELDNALTTIKNNRAMAKANKEVWLRVKQSGSHVGRNVVRKTHSQYKYAEPLY